MIKAQDVDDALHYLMNNADKAASARAERIYVEEFRKSLKAELMKERPGESLGAQEREAYSDQRYRAHLQVIKTAVFNDERERFIREAKQALIEAWRTQCSNERVKI